MKPEQRPNADETHDLKMPRQGVSLLNDVLGLSLTMERPRFSRCHKVLEKLSTGHSNENV